VRIINCDLISNGYNGINVDGAEEVHIRDCLITGNGADINAHYSGIHFDSDCNTFSVIGCVSRDSQGVPNLQKYGLNIEDSTTSKFIIVANDFSANLVSAIQAPATGGYPNRLISSNLPSDVNDDGTGLDGHADPTSAPGVQAAEGWAMLPGGALMQWGSGYAGVVNGRLEDTRG